MDAESLAERVAVLERTIAGGDPLPAYEDAAAACDSLEALSERLEALERRVELVDAHTQALRGYAARHRHGPPVPRGELPDDRPRAAPDDGLGDRRANGDGVDVPTPSAADLAELLDEVGGETANQFVTSSGDRGPGVDGATVSDLEDASAAEGLVEALRSRW